MKDKAAIRPCIGADAWDRERTKEGAETLLEKRPMQATPPPEIELEIFFVIKD